MQLSWVIFLLAVADSTKIVPFIIKWEGGLSSNPNDTASKDPSPCKSNSGRFYHTNKGITWKTFKSLADRLGYKADCATFIKMPTSVWNKIYKVGYWDPMQCDKIKSQVVANALASWAWGSGVTGAKNSAYKFLANEGEAVSNWTQAVAKFNELAKQDEKILFARLTAHRMKFYQSLGQPTFIKGWTNRLNDFVKYNAQYFGPGAIGVVAGVAALVGFFFLNKR